jgi:hypothetical protein
MTATNTGTFLAVISDGNGAFSGSGNYRLTLAKTGDPVVVSSGDDGGPMTNGVMHTGIVQTGDLDLWTFNATTGDSLIVRIGEITTTNTFTPWIRLYGPNGKLLDSGFGTLAGEVSMTATNTGTFLAVISDGNGAFSGSGNYRLTLAKTGDAVIVSAGDDGGPMTNGLMHTGIIQTGDLDLWTFNANIGEAIIMRIGEITDTNSFTPWVRLYGPNGKLLSSGFGSFAGEVTATATNTGTFLAVVSDGNGALSGSGDYRLTLVKSGGLLTTSPGDEGGPLLANVNPQGTIVRGDLDAYAFTACAGETLSLELDELVDNENFFPWLRLIGPNGALLKSVSGATTAQFSLAAPLGGRYLVVVGDGNGLLSGLGTYQLTVNGLFEGFRLCYPLISGTNAVVGAVGGNPGTTYQLLTTTNVTIPLAEWTPLVTNQLDLNGNFSYTNRYSPAELQRYFSLLPF